MQISSCRILIASTTSTKAFVCCAQAAWRARRQGQSVGDAVGGVQEAVGVPKLQDRKHLLQWALRQAAEVRHKQVSEGDAQHAVPALHAQLPCPSSHLPPPFAKRPPDSHACPAWQAKPDQRPLLDMLLKRLGPSPSPASTEDDCSMLDTKTQFVADNLERLIAPMSSPYQQQLRSLNLLFRPKLTLTLSMVGALGIRQPGSAGSEACLYEHF